MRTTPVEKLAVAEKHMEAVFGQSLGLIQPRPPAVGTKGTGYRREMRRPNEGSTDELGSDTAALVVHPHVTLIKMQIQTKKYFNDVESGSDRR